MKTCMRITVVLCLFAVSTLLVGCGTIASIGAGKPAPYSGVRTSCKELERSYQMANAPGGDPLGMSPYIACVGCISMPFLFVDIPLSFAADTLLLPFTFPAAIWIGKKQAEVAEQNLRVMRIYNEHKFTDGPYVDFEEVVRSPEKFKNQVLRARVGMSAVTGSNALTMARLGWGIIPGDGAIHNTTNDIRFWCSGELDARSNTTSWVVLESRSIRDAEEFVRLSTFEGGWEIRCTFERSTKNPDEPRQVAWTYWLGVQKDGDRFEGIIASGPRAGTLRGREVSPGRLEGTLVMESDKKEWDGLTLTLSPYGDLASGEAVFSPTPDEQRHYSIQLRRHRSPFAR